MRIESSVDPIGAEDYEWHTTVRGDTILGLSKLVGGLVLELGQVEYVIRTLIPLMQREIPEADQAFSFWEARSEVERKRTFAELCDWFAAVYGQWEASPDRRDAMSNVLSDLKAIYEIRNHLVHSSWSTGDTGAVLLLRSKWLGGPEKRMSQWIVETDLEEVSRVVKLANLCAHLLKIPFAQTRFSQLMYMVPITPGRRVRFGEDPEEN